MRQQSMTFLCVSFYFKGVDFMKACKAAGNTVYLLTKKDLEHEAWPRESIDEFFYMEDDSNSPKVFQDIIDGLAHLIRSKKIDRIVALDDFDVEKAAYLRETFRVPGMGYTTARYFRDKLAMRMKAEEAGIRIPGFSDLFHDLDITHFLKNTQGPWLIKPRSEASAAGIKKVHTLEEAWQVVHSLGDERHRYLIEQFKPGDVFHSDALSVDGKVIFCRNSKYMNTPFEVAHGGGIFRTHTLEFDSPDDLALRQMNEDVMKGFGMQFSASHTEFIKAHEDGQFYFLETSSRVGGAHIAEMVEASSGINLWAEWARIEDAMAKKIPYQLPEVRNDYAGILVSLSRFEHPDTSAFNDPEIVWRLNKAYHVGMIVRSSSQQRVIDLLNDYAGRVHRDFHASAPAKDKPTH
ncbi:MAG: ATPase [Saprospiraceae bacterium]|nr:ATPase [Saprospiraceae bacterium]